MIDIDAQKADCFVPADRVQIFAAIEAMRGQGGFHQLNVRVKTMLREWVFGALENTTVGAASSDNNAVTHYSNATAKN